MDRGVALTALILTYNEELHLQRCIDSLKGVCREIVIVDSYSSDNTKQIAFANGARFYENKFTNHANQLNWGMLNGEIKTDWIIRVDADEYISVDLAKNIKTKLPQLTESTNGVRVKRLMYFLGKPLKKGGMYPIWHIKLWRNGSAFCEQRWMDERIKLKEGDIATIDGDLIDHNLNNLSWWTEKHNKYAVREAIDILDQVYNFTDSELVQPNFFGSREERRRWFKYRYLKLPLFFRPLLFVIVRYFIQGGFLEGAQGLIWTSLQCGWYRFLVDAKVFEAYQKSGRNREKLIMYFQEEYGYDVTKLN